MKKLINGGHPSQRASLASAACARRRPRVTVGVSLGQAFRKSAGRPTKLLSLARWKLPGDTIFPLTRRTRLAKQLTDVEALIAQGADALIILSVDKDAVGPRLTRQTPKAFR